MEKQKSRGILLIALGSPMYGNFAGNLIASIRYTDKNIPVHLVHSGNSLSHLSPQHKAMFTSIAECPPDYYTKNEKTCYIKAKTCIYELSPFDETIFIDVDLLLFGRKPISRLFDELKDIDFTMQNRGFEDLSKPVLNEKYNIWANVKDVKEVYQTDGKFYQLASEFIYFKRTEANKKFFALVREIFDNPLIKGATFDGDLPDEFAYDIACAKLKHYPHKDNYVVIYWWAMEKKMESGVMMDNYWGYSLGGNHFPDNASEQYHNMAKHYSKAMGLRGHFQITPKRNWNKQRVAI